MTAEIPTKFSSTIKTNKYTRCAAGTKSPIYNCFVPHASKYADE